MTWLVTIVGAYLVGMLPTALIVGRRSGTDPSREGSGNPGASNVYRLAGKRAGVAVGLIDIVKGVVPTLAALLLAGRPEAHAAWAAAVAGHVWPVTRRLRGGKGVATAGGGGMVVNPLVGLICVAVFFAVVRFGRIAALGSLAIAITFPSVAALMGRPWWEVGVAAGVALVLVVRHQSNIRRLLASEERTVRGPG